MSSDCFSCKELSVFFAPLLYWAIDKVLYEMKTNDFPDNKFKNLNEHFIKLFSSNPTSGLEQLFKDDK